MSENTTPISAIALAHAHRPRALPPKLESNRLEHQRSTCHLALHAKAKRSNVSPGQLSLW